MSINISPGHVLAMKALHAVGKAYDSVLDEYYVDISQQDREDVRALIEDRAARRNLDARTLSPKRHRRATLWCAGGSLSQLARLIEPKAVSRQTIHQDITAAVEAGSRIHLAFHRMLVSDEQVIALAAAYNANQQELIQLIPEKAATILWTNYVEPFIDEG